ncbi:MAG: twin-arginine translocation signal domain-containing protein [Pedosphaera sp.]|nr:twin-arginine translocation signal domain-containing protein [Pedosphaera sp.]
MPIHLPPLSRRNFLKRSLLAGAGLALAPEIFAASRRTDENSWALFADLHIAADPAKVAREINMTEHLKAVSAEVLALPARPAGVFVVGDCALDSGEPGDYAQFTSLLDPLRAGGMPLHLALGNHDEREHFWAALETTKTAKRPVADRQVALVESANVNWFILDSLEKTLQTPGLLGPEQLDWLAKSLDANKRKPAVIFVHHNPGTREKIGGLKDTEELLKVLRPRRQAKAWVFGHTHKWRVDADESGLHLVNLPPVAYLFHPGDPAGWVHATTRPDGLKLELRCLDPAHAEHGQVVDLKWRTA